MPSSSSVSSDTECSRSSSPSPSSSSSSSSSTCSSSSSSSTSSMTSDDPLRRMAMPDIARSFDSRAELEHYIKHWAISQGFNIVNAGSQPGRVRLRCHRGGKYDNRHNKGKNKNSATRLTNCPCSVLGTCPENGDGKWRLQVKNAFHNHRLLRPEEAKWIAPARALLRQDLESKILNYAEHNPPRKVVTIMRKEHPSVPLLPRDVANLRQRSEQAMLNNRTSLLTRTSLEQSDNIRHWHLTPAGTTNTEIDLSPVMILSAFIDKAREVESYEDPQAQKHAIKILNSIQPSGPSTHASEAGTIVPKGRPRGSRNRESNDGDEDQARVRRRQQPLSSTRKDPSGFEHAAITAGERVRPRRRRSTRQSAPRQGNRQCSICGSTQHSRPHCPQRGNVAVRLAP